ncbi:MAG TPA: PHP domain-containing protein [Terriglobales bacterium]|nr:PHP domain-containing protein [Terriglobales bacterium]
MKKTRSFESDLLSNSQIAELLAVAAESAKMPLQKALRRASRKAFLWPEEASSILEGGRSLTELPGVGPSLDRIIRRWIENPPEISRPPEIRQNFFTLLQARAVVAKNPAWARKVRGDLQMHTQWSDGSGSVEDMARSAVDRGYAYIAITDHSKGLKIAGGITEEQLKLQGEEIEHVNAKLGAEGISFRVLRSIELNIDPRGNGDMESGALADLDLVLGCFHSSLRKKEDQTERYLAALRNPDIQILGHPRGRIYNFRLGLSVDWQRIFDVAAELDKAVEIDAYPDRQDLSVDLVKLAAKSGCRMSFGTDSHDPLQLRFMEYALASAIEAGIREDRVLNFLSATELVTWAAGVRYNQKRSG